MKKMSRITKDRIGGVILFILLLFVVYIEAPADELDFARYLIEEQEELKSDACKKHAPDELSTEQESNIIIGFALAYCSNYVRHVRQDYLLGWELHLEASEHIDSMDCECSLHTHADSMAYNTYEELTKTLADGGEISPTRVAYCDALAIATDIVVDVAADDVVDVAADIIVDIVVDVAADE